MMKILFQRRHLGAGVDPNPDDVAAAIRRQLNKSHKMVSFPEHLSWSYIARTLYDAAF